MKYLAFIETSDIGVQYCSEAAKRLGFTPIFLINLSQYQGDTKTQILSHSYIDIDTSDRVKVHAALKTLGSQLGAVTSLLDNYIGMAIEMAEAFDCLGLDSALLHLKDKEAIANLVPEFSPSTIPFSLNDDPENTLLDFFKNCPNGMVLKLCRGTGALAMEIVHSKSELIEALQRLKKEQVPAHMAPDSWIAQELIIGQLASCEGYVSEGRVHVIGFTGRKKVHNTESQAIFPCNHELSQESKVMAIEAIKAIVSRGLIKRGYFHTEFIFLDKDCRLIDANFGRVGGGSIGEMLALSFGIDTDIVYQHFLEICLYGKSTVDPYQNKEPIISKCLLYGSPMEQFLEKLELPVPLRSKHMRFRSDGTMVPAMGSNNWAWIGVLTGTSPTVENEFEQIRLHGSAGVTKPIC